MAGKAKGRQAGEGARGRRASARRGRRKGAASAPSGLAALQERFQKAILEGRDDILEALAPSAKEDRSVLLGVYRNAYGARLTEVLENDYEKLALYLGDAQFQALAARYIAAYPSDTPNARWFGRHMAGFLAETPPYDARPELAELAALEAALNDAFDAPDAPALAREQLAGIVSDDWPGLVFSPHAACRRLDFTTNAPELWLALDAGEPPPEGRTVAAVGHYLVWRREEMAMFRPLAPDEAMMWDMMAKGAPFEQLCEAMAAYRGEAEAAPRAAACLQTWLEAGSLSAELGHRVAKATAGAGAR